MVALGGVEDQVAEELAGRRQEIEQQLAYAGTSMEQYLDNEKQTIDEFEAELEKRGWVDAFATGDEFGTFLKEQDTQVATLLQTLGLA